MESREPRQTRQTRRTLDLGRPADPHEREVGHALEAAFDQFQDGGRRMPPGAE